MQASRQVQVISSFEIPITPPPQTGVQDFSEKAVAIMQTLIDASSKRTAAQKDIRKKMASTPYSAYPPAYSFVDTISKVFGENDPVAKIGEYLKELQPAEAFHHPDDCWFSDDERIPINANGRDFFLGQFLPKLLHQQSFEEEFETQSEMVLWMVVNLLGAYFGGGLKPIPENHPIFDFKPPAGKAVSQLSASEQQKFMRSFMKGLGTFDGFLLMFFGDEFEVPQGLFVAVVRYWLDCKIELGESDASRTILRNLVNYPLGRPAQSWDEVALGVADSAWLENIKRIYKEPVDVPFLPCRMSEREWFSSLSDSALWCNFSYDNDAEFYSRALDAWSNKISLLRDDQFGGRYPWQARPDVRYLYDDYEPSNPDWDTHCHFLALFVEEEECGEWGWKGDRYGDNHINEFRSFRLHHNFWLAADREGYPELGNALLAFYLLRKSFMDAAQHEHLEVNWTTFSELLRTALARPGHAYVRQGVEFMKAICREKGWNLDLLRLKNLVPDSGSIIPFPVSTSIPSNEPIGRVVAREIEQQVGSDHWSRLSVRSRKFIVEAEVRFRNITQKIGAGITEFGPETVAYAHGFENELNERLRDIYRSSEVTTYWNAQNPKRPLSPHPTIGSYLKILESDLPADVIKKVEAAGVMLRGKPEILRRLGALKNRRDQGAHTSREVTAEHLHRQRNAIFDEQLLKDFLSGLSPRGTV